VSKQLPLRGEISGHQLVRSSLSDFSVAHMSINNCAIPIAPRPEQRITLRSISIYQCEHYACSAHGARFQDIQVTDLRGYSNGSSQLYGCVYSHVTLRGRMGGLRFVPRASPFDSSLNEPYLAANAAEYRSIDWALDITEAKFGHFFSLVGIPASLIRRDPAQHFVMTREAALVVAHDPGPSVWAGSAQELLELGLSGAVLVIGGSSRLLREYREDVQRLRDRGLLS
jgi:hypothetical protein